MVSIEWSSSYEGKLALSVCHCIVIQFWGDIQVLFTVRRKFMCESENMMLEICVCVKIILKLARKQDFIWSWYDVGIYRRFWSSYSRVLNKHIIIGSIIKELDSIVGIHIIRTFLIIIQTNWTIRHKVCIILYVDSRICPLS